MRQALQGALLSAFVVAQVACDYTMDQVAVGKGKGVFRGWDHTGCECEFDSSVGDSPVVSVYCAPLWDGKDGFGGFLYLWETPINEVSRTGVWSYDGIYGTALMEITSETETLREDTYRAVFIDRLDVPEQDACTIGIGGYYDYYTYETCTPFAGGTLEDVRMWCKEESGGYY